MLNIFRNWIKQDYLRDCQGNRGYGLKIQDIFVPLPITGAYAETEGTITYLFAHKIDDTFEIQDTFIIDVGLIIYDEGQYIFDPSQDLGGYLDEGVYFYEFNDGYETYFSEIFKAQEISELAKCSGIELCSSDALISDLNIPTNGFFERLKTFGEGYGFVEFAD